jgi:hypothetical protein
MVWWNNVERGFWLTIPSVVLARMVCAFRIYSSVRVTRDQPGTYLSFLRKENENAGYMQVLEAGQVTKATSQGRCADMKLSWLGGAGSS